MSRQQKRLLAGGALALFAAGGLVVAQEQELKVPHAECVFYGPRHDELVKSGLDGRAQEDARRSTLTVKVAKLLTRQGAVQAVNVDAASQTSLIDREIFGVMQEAGVKPASTTTDWEFIRRVTLDLTGRIPAPDRVVAFVNDRSADKRSKLVDELLASPQWADKWAVYFGDLYRNTARNAQVNRFESGRNAFDQWLRTALKANKPYNQMVQEALSATGTNSWQQGELNWAVGGFMGGGPNQDSMDLMAANAAEQFLGISHVNCLLCHDGARHLDALNLWGKEQTREQAWGLAAYFSGTNLRRTPVANAILGNPYYWGVTDSATTAYQLNTTSGNRPARQPYNNIRSVAPAYFFTGAKPARGEMYRAALGKAITADPQFARASVNYLWKEFFGRGIVDPVNQFDLARLDPAHPPQAPWTLQPSHPALLNQLGTDFAKNGFDLKWLMRQMVNSEAYQLSSQYDGEWKPEYEKLFARKLVRRLWAEEVHDAIVQSSNVLPTYTIRGTNLPAPGSTAQNRLPAIPGEVYVTTSWALQFPDTTALPDGVNGNISQLLDAFIRGNRDDAERRDDSSILQALGLMNDPFVMGRVRTAQAGANGLINKVLAGNASDEQIVNTLYLSVLSRTPDNAEMQAGLKTLRSGTRARKAEDLLWALYNKVDFLFNY